MHPCEAKKSKNFLGRSPLPIGGGHPSPKLHPLGASILARSTWPPKRKSWIRQTTHVFPFSSAIPFLAHRSAVFFQVLLPLTRFSGHYALFSAPTHMLCLPPRYRCSPGRDTTVKALLRSPDSRVQIGYAMHVCY